LWHLLFFWLLAAGLSLPCQAQLQFPGRPHMEAVDLKDAEIRYVLPPVDPLEMDAAIQDNRMKDKKSLRFAMQRSIDIEPGAQGGWATLSAYRIWRVHIISPGAFSVGLLFRDYELADGVRLFVYDPQMQYVKGAFTSGNNKPSGVMHTGHIPGEEVVVEMQVPHSLSVFGTLRIESVSHGFLKAGRARTPADIRFGRSEACEIDINCGEGSGWQQTKRSVVRIQTPTQYCTGVLVNNTAFDGTPYIITAEHCINRQDVAEASVFVFNYESPSCFDGDGSVEMSISGCDLLATGDSVDFSLVRLSAVPPDTFNIYYAGWDRNINQLSYSSTIHHPMGDVKKISYDFEVPSIPVGLDELPDSDLRDYIYYSYWWVRQWDIGSTEGGSSGAPLFNSLRRVIGTLSGGKAKCGMAIGYDSVANRIIYSKVPNQNDYFTRVSVAWNYYEDPGASIRPWLDPAGSGVISLDGYEPAGREDHRLTGSGRFRVYPNPALETLVIEPAGPVTGEISFRLIDLSGRICLAGTRQKAAGPIYLSPVQIGPGLYLLVIEEGGKLESHKIMIGR